MLDEPTNDLDIETLELLEALLQDYAGTLFLVSHDRAFLDNVVTQTIAFEGDGLLREHVGGYTDWAEYRVREAAAVAAATGGTSRAPVATTVPPRAASAPIAARSAKARTFGEERELAALPGQIDDLEKRLATLRARFADPLLYRDATAEIGPLQDAMQAAQTELGALYARWETLEARP